MQSSTDARGLLLDLDDLHSYLSILMYSLDSCIRYRCQVDVHVRLSAALVSARHCLMALYRCVLKFVYLFFRLFMNLGSSRLDFMLDKILNISTVDIL